MKTNRLTHLIAAAFGFAALSTIGCAEKTPPAAAPSPSTNDPVTAAVTTTSAAPGPAAAIQVAPAAPPGVAPAEWIDIKDETYDTRVHFFAGLARLEARVEEQVAELTAKRAAMKSTVDTKDWDFAMKEMADARSYLKSTGEEARQATPETWAQKKEKIGQAWTRTQDAFGKVKASTTTL